jgi:hypothetical protein
VKLKEAKAHSKVDNAEADWVYLIHHFHPEPGKKIEILHHCYLYSEKNLKGKEYEQEHVKDGKVTQHTLKMKDLTMAPDLVYDHLNNAFKVKIDFIGKKPYAILTGPPKLKDVKWSAQDRG